MSKQIFVSHSQRDKKIRKDVNEIIAIGGLKPICMEFEELPQKKWEKIKDEINESQTIFLMLGKNVTKKVILEIGFLLKLD